jgi:hypothetical protein
VATKRRKIPPRRINEPAPLWAERLLAGERPDVRDLEVECGMLGWLIGDRVPGLPPYDSAEGARLRAVAGL